jgi:bifunctional non-homologous end joining protein LigD
MTDDVTVSKPDKLLWPEVGVTKQLYVDHLRAVADDMLPWLHDRPLSVVRAPDGVGGKSYYQKAVSSYAPDWIRTVEIPAPSAGRDVAYVLCQDVRTLAWLGNQAAVEFHPAPVRRDRLEKPDLFVVDIDPPDDAFDAGVEAALLVLEVCHDLGWEPGVKTTGGKGLHVMVPVERRYDAGALRHAAATLTGIVAERQPGLVTDEFRKAERKGRVMLDPSRNAPGATIVAPYSPRARPDATVSFPVDPARLRQVDPTGYTLHTAAGRLDEPGPRAWRELAERRYRLPSSLLS